MGKTVNLYLHLRAMSHTIYAAKLEQTQSFTPLKPVIVINYNLTFFFRFASKWVIYLDGIISLAHAQCTHLSQVIKSQHKIIYLVVNILNKEERQIIINHNHWFQRSKALKVQID
jgi:hypothetical protein